jgi:NADPH2:quinone reductase
VIATASSEDKRDLALELGADVAIDGEPNGLGDRLIEANGGAKVDVVLETHGGAVFEESQAALAPFGRLVVYGISSRQKNTFSSARLMRTSQGVIGFWYRHCLERREMVDEALDDLFARIRAGELRVIEGGTYPLSQAARAHTDLVARKTRGKLLIDPGA